MTASMAASSLQQQQAQATQSQLASAMDNLNTMQAAWLGLPAVCKG